ncbi:MAG: hypothetical protein H8E44_29020 [Planctomycetes bacterium]|nr:hypothetical protein [Planctomycetota bacterium]MBL7040787.1 hypothetical protein [Pirellulaceae bacterium]
MKTKTESATIGEPERNQLKACAMTIGRSLQSLVQVLLALIIASAALATEQSAPESHGQLGFDKLLLVERHPVESTHPYTFFYMDYRQGGGLCIYDLKTRELTRLVDSTDGEILSADLDYDAKRIVFAWRRGRFDRHEKAPFRPGTHAYVHVYTVGVDGRDLRQLTTGDDFNYDPCWLPDGGIAFISTRVDQWVYCNSGPVGVLHRMDADGSNVVRLSANVLNDFTPSVAADGRILYTRWEYVDKSPLAIQSLWKIRPDGTNLELVFGNRVLSPATFIEAQQIPGTSQLLCTMTGHVKPIRGATGVIDPNRGVNAQAAIQNLTPEVDVRPVDFPDGDLFYGPYESPYPLDDQTYLVSKDGNLLVRDYAGRQEQILLERRGELGYYSARPLRARSRPPRPTSVLPPTDEAGDWAAVYIQDVYNGLEPYVKRGDVKRICVVEEKPRDALSRQRRCKFGVMNVTVSCGATYATRVVWGFADVADDGSAYFQVPAEKPVFFLALDDQGRAVQRMRSYTHLMPGEVQGCIGCHATRNPLPPSQDLAASVFRGQPQSLDLPPWDAPIGFNYEAIVQPVLDAHCVQCHEGEDADAGVRLTGQRTQFFSESYDTLAIGHEPAPPHRFVGKNALVENPYTNWISGFHGVEDNILEIEPRQWGSPRSKLADLVLSGHPDKDGKKRVDLSREEKQRIITWIDLNVPFYGSFTQAVDDMHKTVDSSS